MQQETYTILCCENKSFTSPRCIQQKIIFTKKTQFAVHNGSHGYARFLMHLFPVVLTSGKHVMFDIKSCQHKRDVIFKSMGC